MFNGSRTPDAFELFNNRALIHTGTKRDGYQPACRLRLRRTTAAAACVCEDLTNAALVVVDCNVEVSTANLNLFRETSGNRRTRTRGNLWDGGFFRGGCFLFALHFTDVEYLHIPAAVTVNRNTLTVGFICEQEHLLYVVLRSALLEIHRFRNSVIRVPLECSLHLYMPERRDIMRGHKDFLHCFWDFLHIVDRTGLCNFAHEQTQNKIPLLLQIV